MTEWNVHSESGTHESPLFTDNSVEVVRTWLKNNADYIGVFKEDEDTYWVTLQTGGMDRIAESYPTEDDALDFAAELRDEY